VLKFGEILGGNVNSGQRGLGTMTAPNPKLLYFVLKKHWIMRVLTQQLLMLSMGI
jgi:hypothetical protein